MGRGVRQRSLFGGETLLATIILLVSAIGSVCPFSNTTLLDREIPEIYANITEGNTLWQSLMRECRNPTVTCIQNNMYVYLKRVLDSSSDYEMGGGVLKLTKNNVTYEEGSNEITEGDEKDGEEDMMGRSAPLPLEEVTGALQSKTMKFLMTHDMRLQLPDMVFEGATLQVSPKYFEGNGLMAKLELIPKMPFGGVQTPRILKKIKKFIGDKLMNALMAILLIISLLSVKFMFFMPMVMGVAAAKKLLLKLLLFFFPFLSHLFKLCPYYEPHGLTKFHHHHHSISHLHHVPPHHHPKHPPIVDHHPPVLEHHPPTHEHHPHYDIALDYYSEGPEFTNEFITHRKTEEKQSNTDENEESFSWFGGQGQQTAKRPRKPQLNRPLTPTEIDALTLKAEKEAVLKVRLQQEHQRVQTENRILQDQINQGLKVQEKLRQQQQQSVIVQHGRRSDSVKSIPAGPVSGMAVPSQVLHTPPQSPVYPAQPQAFPLQAPPPKQPFQPSPVAISSPSSQAVSVQAPQKHSFQQAVQQAAVITYDPFYSPILEKIDKILVGIGFNEEPCKERLICSMYKNPTKFSPHSNLLSAQLSRDATELQKPTSTNAAVIRFYRYVQAARDGQDKRECLRLYPACSINTEL